MSLNKAIASGKEHRVEYGTKNQPFAKAIDSTCRNHGTCLWCKNNRLHTHKKREMKFK